LSGFVREVDVNKKGKGNGGKIERRSARGTCKGNEGLIQFGLEGTYRGKRLRSRNSRRGRCGCQRTREEPWESSQGRTLGESSSNADIQKGNATLITGGSSSVGEMKPALTKRARVGGGGKAAGVAITILWMLSQMKG